MTIISLGIGPSISGDELKLIASEPKNDNVFKLSNFDELKTQLDTILAKACAATR